MKKNGFVNVEILLIVAVVSLVVAGLVFFLKRDDGPPKSPWGDQEPTPSLMLGDPETGPDPQP